MQTYRICAVIADSNCCVSRRTHRLRERVLLPPQRPTLAISLQQLQLLHQLAVGQQAEKTTGHLSMTDEVAAAALGLCLTGQIQRA